MPLSSRSLSGFWYGEGNGSAKINRAGAWGSGAAEVEIGTELDGETEGFAEEDLEVAPEGFGEGVVSA